MQRGWMGASPPSAARLPNEAVRLSPSTHTEPTGPAKQHVGVDVDLPLGGCVLLSPQAVEAYCMDEYSAPRPRPPLDRATLCSPMRSDRVSGALRVDQRTARIRGHTCQIGNVITPCAWDVISAWRSAGPDRRNTQHAPHKRGGRSKSASAISTRAACWRAGGAPRREASRIGCPQRLEWLFRLRKRP
jgi:hypothetical protein